MIQSEKKVAVQTETGPADVLLQARGLQVGYQIGSGVLVLIRDVNLVLRPGGLHILHGANGVGKTSLLRTLLQLQTGLAGTVESRALRSAYVDRQDQPDCMLPMVVQSYVRLGLVHRGLDRRQRQEAWQDWPGLCSVLQLKGKENLHLAQLSSGQWQATLLARALIIKPDLLLLDEPTANLDDRAVASLVQILSDYTNQHGTAILISTHDDRLSGLNLAKYYEIKNRELHSV